MKKLITIIVLSLFTIQCGVYHPNIVNIPLLSEKGEGNISGHLSISGSEIQVSYAVSDKYALMFNNMFIWDEKPNKSINYHELGAGLFQPLGKRGRFEIYTGGGFTNNYGRIFLQPNIGVKWKTLELGFSTRLSHVFLTSQGKSYTKNDEYLENVSPALFIEPATTLKFGLKSVKLISQFGFSKLILGSPDILNLPLFISFGVNVNFQSNSYSSRNRSSRPLFR